MGDSARDLCHTAPALRMAIAAIVHGSGLPGQAARVMRAAVLSGVCIVALAPAAGALSLGELEVRSRLGEPLEAQLPLSLGAGESLATGCITQGQGSAGLAPLTGLRVQAPVTSQGGAYTVRLSTHRPLHEPMYGIELKVACPGAPVTVRQYVLMLDLPGMSLAAGSAAALPATAPAAIVPARSSGFSGGGSPEAGSPTDGSQGERPAASTPLPPRPPAPRAARSPIAQGSTYRVSSGDTLSLIAQRVADRDRVGIWDMAALIQQANTDAFINNDPDRIRLGSEIVIPVVGSTAAAALAPDPAPAAVLPLPAGPVSVAPAPSPVAAPEPVAKAATEPPLTVPEETAAPALGMNPVPIAGSVVDGAIDMPAAIQAPSATTGIASPPAADTALLVPPSPVRRGANPLLATAVGVGMGLVISLLFGRISLAGLRRGQVAGTTRREAATPVRAGQGQFAEQSAEDSGITVVESLADEAGPSAAPAAAATPAAHAAAGAAAAAAAAAADRPLAGIDWRDLDEDITDELSALFGDEDPEQPVPTAQEPVLAVEAAAATASPFLEETDLDSLDPSATAEVRGVAWDTLDDAIDGSPDDWVDDTVAMASGDAADDSTRPADTGTSPTLPSTTAIDLPALAASATLDEKLSESLIEALQLLEQDYQQELTATQLAALAEPTATQPMPSVADGDTVDQPAPEKLRRQRAG